MTRGQRMSDAEKQIMELIWAEGGPMTTAELLAKLPEDKSWKQNTVITFLARLTDKGMIKATRMGKANRYEPCQTEAEYRANETRQFVRDVHRGSVSGLIAALCDSGDLKKEEIEELMRMLKEMD